MKFKIFSLALLLAIMSSCGGDADCLQADWVGTYTGTADCDGADSEAATVVITAGPSENTILIDGEQVTISGCSATSTITDPIFGSEITTNYDLDGNTLKSDFDIEILGQSASCTFEGSK